MKKNHFLIAAFAGLFLLGAFARLHRIGDRGFWIDELFHVFAARSYLADASFHTPYWDYEYKRALPITLTAAASFKAFGESETSARLPFAVAHLIFILIAFRILWRRFSPELALLVCGLLLLSPLCIIAARDCRMYAMFQAFYFLGSLAFFAGFESSSGSWLGRRIGFLGQLEERLQIHLGYLILSAPLLVMSAWLQSLTALFGLVVLVYSAFAGWMEAHRSGWRSSVLPKYLLVCLAGVLGFAVACLLFRPALHKIALAASTLPAWAGYDIGNRSFYRYVLADGYPMLFYAMPLGCFYLSRRYGKLGLFTVVSFILPFLILSLAIEWKAERYVIHLLPFFAVCGMAVFEWAGRRLADAARADLMPSSWIGRGVLLAVAIPAMAVPFYPWAMQGLRVPSKSLTSDWKTLPEDLKRDIAAATSVTPNHMKFTYYIGQLPTHYMIDDAPEDYAPARMIRGFEQLRQVLQTGPKAYFITDSYTIHVNKNMLTQEMRNFILENMKPVEHTGDPSILVFVREGKDAGR